MTSVYVKLSPFVLNAGRYRSFGERDAKSSIFFFLITWKHSLVFASNIYRTYGA